MAPKPLRITLDGSAGIESPVQKQTYGLGVAKSCSGEAAAALCPTSSEAEQVFPADICWHSTHIHYIAQYNILQYIASCAGNTDRHTEHSPKQAAPRDSPSPLSVQAGWRLGPKNIYVHMCDMDPSSSWVQPASPPRRVFTTQPNSICTLRPSNSWIFKPKPRTYHPPLHVPPFPAEASLAPPGWKALAMLAVPIQKGTCAWGTPLCPSALHQRQNHCEQKGCSQPGAHAQRKVKQEQSSLCVRYWCCCYEKGNFEKLFSLAGLL